MAETCGSSSKCYTSHLISNLLFFGCVLSPGHNPQQNLRYFNLLATSWHLVLATVKEATAAAARTITMKVSAAIVKGGDTQNGFELFFVIGVKSRYSAAVQISAQRSSRYWRRVPRALFSKIEDNISSYSPGTSCQHPFYKQSSVFSGYIQSPGYNPESGLEHPEMLRTSATLSLSASQVLMLSFRHFDISCHYKPHGHGQHDPAVAGYVLRDDRQNELLWKRCGTLPPLPEVVMEAVGVKVEMRTQLHDREYVYIFERTIDVGLNMCTHWRGILI